MYPHSKDYSLVFAKENDPRGLTITGECTIPIVSFPCFRRRCEVRIDAMEGSTIKPMRLHARREANVVA